MRYLPERGASLRSAATIRPMTVAAGASGPSRTHADARPCQPLSARVAGAAARRMWASRALAVVSTLHCPSRRLPCSMPCPTLRLDRSRQILPRIRAAAATWYASSRMASKSRSDCRRARRSAKRASFAAGSVRSRQAATASRQPTSCRRKSMPPHCPARGKRPRGRSTSTARKARCPARICHSGSILAPTAWATPMTMPPASVPHRLPSPPMMTASKA